MPDSFDYSWSSGPLGVGPAFSLLSAVDLVSERNYVAGEIWSGAGVYLIPGVVAQYSTASGATTATLFRRTISRRIGSRSLA